MARPSFRDHQLRLMLGLRIRRLRKARGVGTTDLAERCGWANRAPLLHVERATAGVSLEKLIRLADELHTTTDYLLGRTETP